MIKVLALLLFLIFVPTQAFAQNIMTSENLLKACTTPQMNWIDFCNGFFQAVHDQQSYIGAVCTDEQTIRTELVEIFETNAVKILMENPKRGSEPGISLAAEILREEFPCR